MRVESFLEELDALGIELETNGENLTIDAPKNTLTPDLVQRLKAQKSAIIEHLVQTPITMPMTDMQRDVWLALQLQPEVAQAYNLANGLHLSGDLQADKLHQALNQLVQRHESLRTLPDENGETQHIWRVMPFDFPQEDISHLPQAQRQARLEAIKLEEVTTPFNLFAGPLFRAKLVKLMAKEHVLLFTAHHIIADGWSVGVMVQNVAALYSAACQGKKAELPDLVQFRTFVENQQASLSKPSFEKAKTYWLDEFSKSVPVLDLPTDRARLSERTFAAIQIDQMLEPQLVAQVKQAAARQNSTFFAFMLTAFHTFLHRVSGQSEIVVGVPVAGQMQFGERDLVGDCVNFLPIMVEFAEEMRFDAALTTTARQKLPQAFSHQDYPFASLLKELPINRDLGRMPLISVAFNLFPAAPVTGFYGLSADNVLLPHVTELYDMYLTVIDKPNGCELQYRASTDLFDEATMRQHIASYLALLKAAATKPEELVAALPLLDKETYEKVVVAWNQTAVSYPNQPTPLLVQAQAAQTPGKTAVLAGNVKLSYEALAQQANQLAYFLQSKGVGPNTLVGVAMPRSIEMVVALLGIWKAGGAYVPLDPDYPQARLAHMIQDSGMKWLLTTAELQAEFAAYETEMLVWHTVVEAQQIHPKTPPEHQPQPEHLAYVIYTSGSTGLPKGVQIPHQALTNFLFSMQREPGLTDTDILANVTTLSFDIHGLELWLPLITGAEVVIVPPEIATDGLRLAALLDETETTVMQATPATWKLLLDAGWNGRSHLKMLCGGEPLPKSLATKLLAKGGELWNMYGPTETTIWSAVAKIEPDTAPITIGRPIANTQMYVLNKQRQPVPPGVVGELFIGGDGVALGYLNRDELTQERFIQNPFGPGKIYNTGDLAKQTNSGEFVCLGRTDFQVKVRGFRIELGEIEAVLARHPQVADVIVIVREDQEDDKRIVAYYRANDGTDAVGLRPFASQSLPYYMVPSNFVRLDAFPLTPNGKIDRQRLPQPDQLSRSVEQAFVAPQTDIENVLAETWCAYLHLEKVSITDNFFELGGHSLIAVQIVSRVNQLLETDLALASLFQMPTIAELAQQIAANRYLEESDVLLNVEDEEQEEFVF